MVRLLKTPVLFGGGLFLAAMLAQAQDRIGRPGMVNYIQGQVLLNGQVITTGQLGRTEVAPGQILRTEDGKAEMLLTPGAFLRLDAHSAVKMVSPSLTNTAVELINGKTMVEADQVEKENHLAVTDHGANVVLEKKGIYEFNANDPLVAVYDGKAKVQENDRETDVGKGKELLLTNNPALKAESFDRRHEDDLYAWSKLRSEYISEANMATAQTIVVNNPGWWYGTGWYWNPWFSSWAFVPGGGFLYSPFGFGFYSPAYWYSYAPFYYRPHYGFVGRTFAASPGFAAPAVRGPALHSFGAGRAGGFGGLHR
jgi:hypothetical protein